jgi:hypothetical protein
MIKPMIKGIMEGKKEIMCRVFQWHNVRTHYMSLIFTIGHENQIYCHPIINKDWIVIVLVMTIAIIVSTNQIWFKFFLFACNSN